MLHLDSLTLLVVVMFFGATLVRSALGLGEALIAVPLLAGMIGYWAAGMWTPSVSR
jgi:hypothetical protein